MPFWYSYGKFRASYGIVGNAPEAYAANMAYTFGSGPGWSYNQVPNNLGNENLKPEKTKEFEIGIENKFLITVQASKYLTIIRKLLICC